MPTLGYWNIRGMAAPIRYLLHFIGIEFEDKLYYFPTIEDKSVKNYSGISEEWQNDKLQLNLDFPNLPYYIDDKVRLTQSTAILRYLARKHGLLGETEEEKLRVELAEQQINDLRVVFAQACYSPRFENIKEDFIRNAPNQLKPYSDFLGDRKFLSGDNVTYVDFMAYSAFDSFRYLIPTLFNEFPNLKKYIDRIESLPGLKEYLQSPAYVRWPILSPYAYFAGEGPEPKRV